MASLTASTCIATPFTPKTYWGRRIVTAAIDRGPILDRTWLADAIRRLRGVEGRHAAQHCLAWLDWIGGYPVKTSSSVAPDLFVDSNKIVAANQGLTAAIRDQSPAIGCVDVEGNTPPLATRSILFTTASALADILAEKGGAA